MTVMLAVTLIGSEKGYSLSSKTKKTSESKDVLSEGFIDSVTEERVQEAFGG